MTPTTKNRILIAIVAVVIAGVAAVILLLQPASEKAEASEATGQPTASSSAMGVGPAALPNISAANPGQAPSNQDVAVPPDRASPTDLPKATISTASTPYKQEVEKQGNEFLKIYFNNVGADMETPTSYLDKLAPFAGSEFLDGLRKSSTATEWGGFGKFLHEKRLNITVEPTCSLAEGQAFAPVFDEADGGNLPCTFKQTVVNQDGKKYTSNDLGVEAESWGSQSLKMVKEDGVWKVAAFDSFAK